jgi:hypothetical protein
MCKRALILAVALAGCAGRTPAPAAPSSSGPGAADPEAAPDEAPVARVDSQILSARMLSGHQDKSGLPHDEAIEDLIDLTLLRAAAKRHGVPVEEGMLAPEARAAAEYAVALKLAIDLPPPQAMVVVDHAWVKNADDKKTNAAQKAAIEKLRTLVAAGTALPAAWTQLKLPAEPWHVGNHEEYPADVIPAAARKLQPGGLSPVIPGDGGLHLFKLHAHKQSPPAPDVVRPLLRARLREGKVIERLDRSQP